MIETRSVCLQAKWLAVDEKYTQVNNKKHYHILVNTTAAAATAAAAATTYSHVYTVDNHSNCVLIVYKQWKECSCNDKLHDIYILWSAWEDLTLAEPNLGIPISVLHS